MDINKYKDSSFNDIISRFIPNDILSLNPIIAGGFPLSIYRSLKIYDGNKGQLLMRDLGGRMESFGDIDLWFLNSSSIHDEKSYYNNLIRSNLSMGQLAAHKSLSRRTNDSRYAVTYRMLTEPSNRIVSVQIIKEPQESACSLLSKFDYINCAIAWHDGYVYLANDLDNCFDSFELRHNSLYESEDDESMATMMFRSLRALKYAKRYSLDPDGHIARYIFETYFRIKNFKPDEARNTSVQGGPYGSMDPKDYRICSMASNLRSRFLDFVKMKSFRGEYALYLVDSTFLPIKDALACLGLSEFQHTNHEYEVPF